MKNIIKFYLFSFILLSNFELFAQGGPGDLGDGGLEGGDPAPAPIDGKITLLIISALIFAFYKLKKNTKKA
jgi:hypothetical protein